MIRISLKNLLAAAAVIVAAQRPASAEINYFVRPSADLQTVSVKMKVPTVGGSPIEVQLPSWMPGYYVLENFWQSLKEVKATDAEGHALTVAHPKGDTWSVDPGQSASVTIEYTRPLPHGEDAFGIFSGDAETALIQGTQVYLYAVGRKEEQCTLDVEAPANAQAAIGLEESAPGKYTALDYDTLADCPLTIGKLRIANYTVRGIPHTIAVRGRVRANVDMQKALKLMRFISTAESDFFDGLPYRKYVWQINASLIPDGGGGLEHASSSQDFMAVSMGTAAVRGLAHEFFHLWNVKRIRSQALGPFDYTVLPRTGALWWLEGVTDYYASLLPYRYGWYGDKELLGNAAYTIAAVRNNANRLHVSPYESSLRVADADGGKGNSNGYLVSYYEEGWVLGLMFDIELRARSEGKVSLDTVERALWKQYQVGKPGFEEDEIRKQLILAGGEEFGPLYDAWVMKPGELPIEAQLAKIGLLLTNIDGRASIVADPNASQAAVALRAGWLKQKPLPEESKGAEK